MAPRSTCASLHADDAPGQARWARLGAGIGLWATALGVPAFELGLPPGWSWWLGAAVLAAPLVALVAGVATRRESILLAGFPCTLVACALADARWTSLVHVGGAASVWFGIAALAWVVTVIGASGWGGVVQVWRRHRARGVAVGALVAGFALAALGLGLWVGLGPAYAARIDEAWGDAAPLGSTLAVLLGLAAAIVAVGRLGRDAVATEGGLRARLAEAFRRAMAWGERWFVVAAALGLAWARWASMRGAP